MIIWQDHVLRECTVLNPSTNHNLLMSYRKGKQCLMIRAFHSKFLSSISFGQEQDETCCFIFQHRNILDSYMHLMHPILPCYFKSGSSTENYVTYFHFTFLENMEGKYNRSLVKPPSFTRFQVGEKPVLLWVGVQRITSWQKVL